MMWLLYFIIGHFISGFISGIIQHFLGNLVNDKTFKEILIMTLYGYIAVGLLLACIFLDVEEWYKNRKK